VRTRGYKFAPPLSEKQDGKFVKFIVIFRAGFNWLEAWGPVYLGKTGRLQQLYD